MCAKSAVARGVWGHAPPGNFLNFRRSEIDSVAFWDTFLSSKASVIAVVKKSTVAKNQQLPCNRIR